MKKSSRAAKAAVKPGAKTAGVESGAKAAPIEVKREHKDVALAKLIDAPWNSRKKITPESVADLTASIESVGVIEPLIVMAGAGDGEYIIIAGHRRAAAARAAKGVETVPCDILVGIDEASARRMTFLENLQRKDADPLLESKLVGKLIADGMTQAEIASETGRGEKWVARRLNLSKLSPSWRKRASASDAGDMTVDCLEHIAAYPVATQEKIFKAVGRWNGRLGPLKWDDIRYHFALETLKLSEALFDTAKCLNCLNNSGCAPELFDWDGRKPTKLGMCLDMKCYNAKHKKHIADTLKAAKAADQAIVEGRAGYDVKTSAEPTKKCNTLYHFWDYSGKELIEWGEPPKKEAAREAGKSSEEELKEKREKRERNKAIRHLRDICDTDGNLAKWLADYSKDPLTGGIDTLAPILIQLAFSGIDSYRLLGSGSTKQKMAQCYLLGNCVAVPMTWAEAAASDIIKCLDPSKSGGFYAGENAELICTMFREKLGEAGLTAEEFDLISPDAGKKFHEMKIDWNAEEHDPYNPEDAGEKSEAGEDPDGEEV